MSDKDPGWYPDPDGENRQRYWDGSSWTEYFTPLPAAQVELHGSATAVEDYPYLAATRTGAHHQVMTTPGTAASGWPTPGGRSTGETEGATQEFSGAGSRSSASRWALVAATALVLMLVIGVGWWAIGGRGGDDPTADGPTETGPPPTDGPTTSAALALDSSISGEIEVGGMLIGELTIDTTTVVMLDARSDDDLVLELISTPDGDVVGRNDDRPNNLAAIGDSGLNPLLFVTLEPGTYEAQLRERNGEDTDAELVATTLPQIQPGSPTSASVPDRGGWFGYLDVAADADYRVDVSATDSGDAVLVLLGPDDDVYFNDDRTSDDRNPLLEQTLTAGTWVVAVYEYRRDATDITLTVDLA